MLSGVRDQVRHFGIGQTLWATEREEGMATKCQQCKDELLGKAVAFVVALQRDVQSRRAAPGRTHSCRWKADEDGNWWSSCGEGFVFNDGGPVENRMRYCPYCGKRLVVTA